MRTGRESTNRDWDFFIHKLQGAIALSGGSGGADVWQNKTLKEVYKNLHPNGIKLGFSVKVKDYYE